MNLSNIAKAIAELSHPHNQNLDLGDDTYTQLLMELVVSSPNLNIIEFQELAKEMNDTKEKKVVFGLYSPKGILNYLNTHKGFLRLEDTIVKLIPALGSENFIEHINPHAEFFKSILPDHENDVFYKIIEETNLNNAIKYISIVFLYISEMKKIGKNTHFYFVLSKYMLKKDSATSAELFVLLNYLKTLSPEDVPDITFVIGEDLDSFNLS